MNEFHGEYKHATGESTIDIYETGFWAFKRYRAVSTFTATPDDDTTPYDTITSVDDAHGFKHFEEAYQWGWDWICGLVMNG